MLAEDFVITDIPLQIRREGKSKKLLKPSPVVYVRNYKSFLSKIIQDEIDEIEPAILEDGSKQIEIGLAADSGGGSMKMTISIMNRIDQRVKLHPILIYEAGKHFFLSFLITKHYIFLQRIQN